MPQASWYRMTTGFCQALDDGEERYEQLFFDVSAPMLSASGNICFPAICEAGMQERAWNS